MTKPKIDLGEDAARYHLARAAVLAAKLQDALSAAEVASLGELYTLELTSSVYQIEQKVFELMKFAD